jgi:hypothetical protein
MVEKTAILVGKSMKREGFKAIPVERTIKGGEGRMVPVKRDLAGFKNLRGLDGFL